MGILLIWREIKKKTGSREVRKSGRPEVRSGQGTVGGMQLAVGSRQSTGGH